MSSLLINDLQDLSLKPRSEAGSECEAEIRGVEGGNHEGVCAICLDKIVLQETALVKGCEHAYCVTCILRWATYSQKVTCPQCKHPFDFLFVHRSLDGCIHDYMFEESVCLLLRASWFKPLKVEDHVDHEDVYDGIGDYYQYEYGYEDEDEDEDLDEVYYGSSSSLRIGNRRWGDNGYVRAGRLEARPVYRPNFQESGGASSSRESKKKEAEKRSIFQESGGASSSHEPKKKEAEKSTTGRRAKRALKREAADKAAAAKHQQHLMRLGRK